MRIALKLTSAEKACLCVGRRPAELGIAVREAAEASNDLAMILRVREPRLPKLGIEFDRDVLIRQVFRMREWQTEEQPQIQAARQFPRARR